MFRLTVLIDNNPHPYDTSLLVEHGLSFYFELNGEKYLFDVGASDGFYQNAMNLGISIEEVDSLFISHGHRDHTGGLEKFLEANSKAKIYLSEQVTTNSFYSCRRGYLKDISTPSILNEVDPSRLIFIDENKEINQQIRLINHFPNTHSSPVGNKTLFSGNSEAKQPDSFDHEMALHIHTNRGDVILSACTHHGILNTLLACTNSKNDKSNIKAYIGGTHLLDSDENNQYETEDDLITLSKTLLEEYPNMKLITGHCTGCNTMQQMQRTLENNFEQFYSGFTYSI